MTCVFDLKLPDINTEQLSNAQVQKKLLEYLLHISRQLKNMQIGETDLDEALKERIDTAVKKAVESSRAVEKAKKALDIQVQKVTDIGADSKITAVEKLTAKQLWDAIVAEGTPETGTLTAQAITLDVSVAAFDTAYAALNVYLNTTLQVFADMTDTTPIVRTAWDAAWNDYYDERTKLLNAIGAKANALVAAVGTFDSIDLANPVISYLGMRLGQFASNPTGWSGIAPGSGMRWNIGNAYEWGIIQDQYGNPTIWTNDYLFIRAALAAYISAPTLFISDDIYIGDNCSAQSFTDRTPDFDGDALKAIEKIKSDGKGGIDHASLPEQARKRVKVTEKRKSGKKKTVREEDGRDIGMMVSMLVKGVQQLINVVKDQEKAIQKLKDKGAEKALNAGGEETV